MAKLNDGGIIELENKPTNFSNTPYPQYTAILQREHSDSASGWQRGYDGSYILKILSNHGSAWSLTPGQWYLDTLLGYDAYGRRNKKNTDEIYIDAGSGWKVGNMKKVLDEAEKAAYGSDDLMGITESFYPRLVEGIKDYENTPRMRNWYQKLIPEKIKRDRKPKMPSKVLDQIDVLRDEIFWLKQSISDEKRMNRDFENGREDFMGWIQEEYDWNVLDILASGNDEDKKRKLELWNANQDRKDKVITDIDGLIDEYNEYYPNEEDSDKIIQKLSNEIKLKEDEINQLESMYESMNEGLSRRINFKRFEDEILRPLAMELKVEFRIGRLGKTTSVGKKVLERYYGIGPLTILVRDIKRVGMPGDDVEPWIMDSKSSTKGISFGSEWGSYKKFQEKIRELLTPNDDIKGA